METSNAETHSIHQNIHVSQMQMQPTQVIGQQQHEKLQIQSGQLIGHKPQHGQLQMSNHSIPVQLANATISNGQNVIRSLGTSSAPRYQITRTNQPQHLQTLSNLSSGQNRPSSNQQMSQSMRVIQQNMFQPMSSVEQASTLTPVVDVHSVHPNIPLDQHRPQTPSYMQQPPNVQQSIPMTYQSGHYRRRLVGTPSSVYNTTIRGNMNQQTMSTVSNASSIRVVPATGGSTGPKIMRLVNPHGTSSIQQNQQQHFNSAQQDQQAHQLMNQRLSIPRPVQMKLQQHQHSLVQSNQHSNMNISESQHSSQMGPGSGGVMVSGGSKLPVAYNAVAQDSQENILETLSKMAARYLPWLNRAIEMASQQPNMESMLNKYNSVKEILERRNVTSINKYSQLQKLDNFLKINVMNVLHKPQLTAGQQIRFPTTTMSMIPGTGPIQHHFSDHQQHKVSPMQQQLRLLGKSHQVLRGSTSSLNSLLSQPTDLNASHHPGHRNTNISGPVSGQFQLASTSSQQASETDGALTESLANASQNNSAPISFCAKLDAIKHEFEDIAKQCAQDKKYASLLVLSVNEISEETRQYRKKSGHLLPSDLYFNHSVGIESVKNDDVPIESETLGENRKKRLMDDASPPLQLNQFPIKQEDPPSEIKVSLKNTLLHTENSLCDEDKIFCKQESIDDIDGKKTDNDLYKILNTKILQEICSIESMYGVKISINTSPPSIAVMETYYTCRNQAEWNNSCHLKLEFDDELIPCTLPHLCIRLPPNYLTAHCVNWFMDKTQLTDDCKTLARSFYSAEEVRTFLKKVHDLVQHSLTTLRKINSKDLNLSNVAKTWISCIFTAAANFMNSDLASKS